jgi:hypothetical protein
MDKRTKAQLLERIAYLERRNKELIGENEDSRIKIRILSSNLNSSAEVTEKLSKEISRLNDLVSATTQENNRLTIERNAANALVDRIRIPSEMNISVALGKIILIYDL